MEEMEGKGKYFEEELDRDFKVRQLDSKKQKSEYKKDRWSTLVLGRYG